MGHAGVYRDYEPSMRGMRGPQKDEEHAEGEGKARALHKLCTRRRATVRTRR